jgi:hypothetical protein
MRRLPALLALLLALALPAGASAQEMSSNVERVATIPELATAISLNFIDDTMFVSTAAGIFSYDVSDPAAPKRLGALPMYIWENEDVDVDVKRKRLFISRDPRGFTTPASPGAAFPYGAVHIIDVSNPATMVQVGFFTLGAGHTTTCVNDCDVIWTAGPYANAETQPDYVGRPVYGTDVTDPANPKPCPAPIDTERNDGVTDYAHDVQVDAQGIAWVSGAGGIRGYWTSGTHRNPVTGRTETATGCAPIPYAGSGTPDSATPSRFMHNSYREPDPNPSRAEAGLPPVAAGPTYASSSASFEAATAEEEAAARAASMRATAAKTCSTKRGSRAARKRCAKLLKRCAAARKKGRKAPKGCPRPAKKKKATQKPGLANPAPAPARPLRERVLYGTEENVVSECETAGRFATYDLEGTFDGEGFKDIKTTKHRMKALDTWTPEKQEGSSGCASAHYFDSRGDGIFANSFYEQGVRFLDVSNPSDIRQVGWYRPSDANVWAPYWHKGYVFVADFTRGVDVLKFNGSKRSVTRTAPVRNVVKGSAFDPQYLGGLCPLPRRSA